MKVLHVISGLRGGGAEHFVLELCRQSLNDKGAGMSVLSLSASDEIAYKFRETDIEVISASASKNKRGINAVSGFRVLLKHPYTIVHAHMFHACMVACFAKLFRPSIKIIFTLHNNYIPQFHRRLLLFLSRPLRKTDIIFPGMDRKWFQKSNAIIISNGINVSRYQHLHIDKPPLFTCVFVGRLAEEKNPLFLVDLAKSLSPEHKFMIRVAGEGPQKKELQQRITEENLQNYFTVHGHVEDVARLLAESHCLLLPSDWEGMPLILLEGGAAGIPVIATPVGNIPSILNKENGYVGDIKKFRSMITEVMDNYGDALIRARKLMHIVHEHYNIEEVYRQYRQVYENVGYGRKASVGGVFAVFTRNK
jgi:glycosyltransferase involved in cell wall biosynthesis